ncbi:TetR/AcrR family transcriptional regulator [Nocardiopsis sp. CNT-189]|uniref:TetR/AcrR family transcriptional regulator n=1 Tax=Nocardiopsis oceanisediminis TaxID=2816862 RepID=UPI003B3836C8
MTTEYAGQGDPGRTLGLLWGTKEQPRRGPRPKLTVPQIAAAAIRVADEDGLDALSMRRVAERLEVVPMSLYTYVPGKHELIDLMLDTVIGEVPPADGHEGEPRARMERMAREDWAFFHRHPWVLEISGHRPAMGPNSLAAFGSGMRALSGLGLSGAEQVMVISLLDGYVRGMARESIDAAQAERRTGVSDDQWWSALLPHWTEHADPRLSPDLADPSVGAAVFGGYEEKFDFGLQRLLDGVQAFIGARGAETGR